MVKLEIGTLKSLCTLFRLCYVAEAIIDGPFLINRKYVYSVIIYQKYTLSNEFGRSDYFRALARQLSFLPTELNIFIYTTTLHTYSIYLSTFHLLSFIISNTVKHEFSNIWK